MIPRRAFFTWVGDGDLPWLRQLSVDSFARFNPDWEIEILRLETDDYLCAAQITDIERYRDLHQNGGLYLDTDIVFIKPVPEDLLDAELALTIDKSAFRYNGGNQNHNPETEYSPGFNNLALLAAEPGCPFFGFMFEKALERLEWLEEDSVDVKRLIYQAFGTQLMNRLFYGKNERQIMDQIGIKRFYNVPLPMILPVGWFETYKLFNNTPFEPPDECIGVHWYGGDVDAKRYQKQFCLETYRRRPCYLSSAIDRALADEPLLDAQSCLAP